MSSCENKGHIHVNPTASIEHCDTTLVTPTGGTVTLARVAVPLGQYQIDTALSANITFPDPVLEIKDAKKVVKIVQCALMLSPQGVTPPFDQLVIRGFVRKNIQYATPMMGDGAGHHHWDASCVRSDIRSFTCDIPFQCSAPVTFIAGNGPIRPVPNTRSEFDFFRSRDLGTGFPEKDHLLSNDLSQFHQQSFQNYNPFPFCELVSSQILEWDEATNRETFPHANVGEGVFTNVVEKMFLRFNVNVFQNQIITALT